MLIFSFICSVIFCVVLLTFTFMLIISIFNQRKFLNETKEKSNEFFNGFVTLDLNSEGGADDKEKE